MAYSSALTDETSQAFRSSMRADLRGAAIAIFCFFVIGGIWTGTTEISGAVVASGQVTVEANLQHVQYLEGGVVSKILVANGDEVQAGQVLVTMDKTALTSQYDISRSRVVESYLLQARLEAELADKDSFEVPKELIDLVGNDGIDAAFQSQMNLLRIDRANLKGQRELLAKQIEQTKYNIEGLNTSSEEFRAQLDLLDQELQSLEKLLEKNLVQKSRVLDQRRTMSALKGQIAQNDAQVAGAESSVSQLQLKLIQLDDTTRQNTLTQFQNTRAQLGELINVFVNQRNMLARADIKAPRAGIVHELAVNTPGQVVQPGGELMLIVPKDDALVIEVKIPPADVDQVHVGQDAEVKLAAFDARLLPNLKAKVTYVSADAVLDPTKRYTYFTVRVALNPGEVDKLQGIVLVPGMPSQVFIQRQSRTVLTFLLQPILERLDLTFRQ